MTSDDSAMVSLLVSRLSKYTPSRYILPTITKDGTYDVRKDMRTCAVGAVIIGTVAITRNPYTDAGSVLNIPVSMVIGIAMGFDGGQLLHPISPMESRGIDIGIAVSKKLLDKTPETMLTPAGHTKNFWP